MPEIEPPVKQREILTLFGDFQEIIYNCDDKQYLSIVKVLNTLTSDIKSKKKFIDEFYIKDQDPIKLFARFLCCEEMDGSLNEKFSKKDYKSKIDKLNRFREIIVKAENEYQTVTKTGENETMEIESWWETNGHKTANDLWCEIFKS